LNVLRLNVLPSNAPSSMLSGDKSLVAIVSTRAAKWVASAWSAEVECTPVNVMFARKLTCGGDSMCWSILEHRYIYSFANTSTHF
jgi:hypothetical protein